MQRNKLTFNDLPEVVGELCERISSMENLLTEKLHQQHNEVKKDTHVPMTVDELDKWLESGRKGDTPISIEEEHARMLATTRRKANPKNW